MTTLAELVRQADFNSGQTVLDILRLGGDAGLIASFDRLCRRVEEANLEVEMALSDYLMGDEWDACFYASMGRHNAENFGDSMRKTINLLLSTGYRFPGLNDQGGKRQQIGNGINAKKMTLWFGNPYRVDVLGILENGRSFLKAHVPELVDETDEEWARQMAEARERAE